MKSRMEKYYTNEEILERTRKNNKLYDDVMTDTTPSSNVSLIDNVSEIDISKIKELLDSREGYQRVRKYQDIVNNSIDEDEENNKDYDIYEDIENRIYDINSILEEARSRRKVNEEREKRRRLKTTQYNILSKLDLNAQNNDSRDNEEMDSNFFATDKELTKLVIKTAQEEVSGVENKENTNNDLFGNLKGTENTIMTDPVKVTTEIPISSPVINTTNDISNEKNTFYTNALSFTKEDFEEISNLKTTVKSNSRLIKILIFILLITMITIISLIALKFI